MPSSKEFVESLSRGVKLLTILAESPEPLGLTELAKKAELSTTTVHRLTFTLQSLDVLLKDEKTKKFQLGPKMISLSQPALTNLDIRKVARPYMEKTSKEVGENVSLGTLVGVKVAIIEKVNANNILNFTISNHSKIPVSCFAIGKVMLAALPEAELRGIIDEIDLSPMTEKTITSERVLLKELKKVKTRGFGVNNQEAALGARAVAAPVRDHTGRVIAAVNIMVPSFRMSRKVMETQLAEKVKTLGENISLAMGYKKSPDSFHH